MSSLLIRSSVHPIKYKIMHSNYFFMLRIHLGGRQMRGEHSLSDWAWGTEVVKHCKVCKATKYLPSEYQVGSYEGKHKCQFSFLEGKLPLSFPHPLPATYPSMILHRQWRAPSVIPLLLEQQWQIMPHLFEVVWVHLPFSSCVVASGSVPPSYLHSPGEAGRVVGSTGFISPEISVASLDTTSGLHSFAQW